MLISGYNGDTTNNVHAYLIDKLQQQQQQQRTATNSAAPKLTGASGLCWLLLLPLLLGQVQQPIADAHTHIHTVAARVMGMQLKFELLNEVCCIRCCKEKMVGGAGERSNDMRRSHGSTWQLIPAILHEPVAHSGCCQATNNKQNNNNKKLIKNNWKPTRY